MSSTTKKKPDFISSFSNGSLVEEDKAGYKFSESFNYWIFKYGDIVYKVYKKPVTKENESIETHLMEKLERNAGLLSPDLEFTLWVLEQNDDSFKLLPIAESQGNVIHFVFRMNFFPANRMANFLIEKGKLNQSHLALICESLWEFHSRTKSISDRYTGTCDHMQKIFDDLVYQSKKYLHRTFSQAVINMTTAPVQRFLAENKRLFFLRAKNEKIRETHRCLVPSKICVLKDKAIFIPMHFDNVIQSFSDVASDLADFALSLQMKGMKELSNDFVSHYVKISNDKEVLEIMPFYLVLKAYQRGLYESLKLSLLGEDSETLERASNYYDKAAELATELSNLVTTKSRNKPVNQEPILD